MSRDLDLTDAGLALLATVEAIGTDVVAPAAEAVDAESRFPMEAIEALRNAGLLGALVPEHLGGAGCSISDITAMCTALGRHCSSAAMVFAMHQIQMSCLVRHGSGHQYFDDLMSDLAHKGRLIASATTEAGVGGDVRSSICAVEHDGDKFRLSKNAQVISYGEYVDDVLVTARANLDASANDQVLVHVQRPDLQLEPSGSWNAMGMRGTCSIGFQLTASGTVDQILPAPYAEISGRTMLPVSHLTWASLWLGIAMAAVERARTFVRSAARKTPGTLPPSATRLAAAHADLERIRATVSAGVREYERVKDDVDASNSMAAAIRFNNVKITVSQDVPSVVQQALSICGIAGYRNDTPFSLGRHLRDSLSASLMVHNDRITAHNAGLLCVSKEG